MNAKATETPIVTLETLKAALPGLLTALAETQVAYEQAKEAHATAKADSETRLAGVSEGFFRLSKAAKAGTCGSRFELLETLAKEAHESKVMKAGKALPDAKAESGRITKTLAYAVSAIAEGLKASAGVASPKVTYSQLEAYFAGKSGIGVCELCAFAGFVSSLSESNRLEKAVERKGKEVRETENAIKTLERAEAEAKAKAGEAEAKAEAVMHGPEHLDELAGELTSAKAKAKAKAKKAA